ncbi:MAG: PAS domain S-box protein, partial [Ginsengibacter sp.]
MYIAWGKEYIQLYNDGYRPILGATKHPQALGIGTRETFAEIWPTIGPMFKGVMQGTPVGFPDFILHLDRNGYVEECVFDFSYSPIRLDDGEVAGVLVTVIETTEKVKAVKALKESEQELQFAIEATELGTWELNPATGKFRGNNRLKEWFGLEPNVEIELPAALAVIADKEREKVKGAIQKALQFSSGGHYDITYTIIHPQTKNERIVRAKGLAFFNNEGIAYRFNGTLQDVTKEMVARQLLIESEQRLDKERVVLYNSFMNAPAGIAILKGNTHVYEFANAEYEKLVDRKIIIGKTVEELFPEIEQQGLIDILNNVFSTGEPFIANEFPVELIDKSTGKLVLHYYNSVMQPIKDQNGNTDRLLSHGVEVTQQVTARKLIEEANQTLRLAATLTENIADAVVGTDMDYKTISWNKGAENLYGYASEEVMGKYAMELLSTQFLSDEDKQEWSKALDATGKWQGEVVQSKKDGTLVSVLVSISYVYDENGKPIAAVAVNRDITERKKAEEKIAASEAKFRTLSETVPHMIWTAEPDGKRNFFNQYTLDYTGKTIDELFGDGWQKMISPLDLPQTLKHWRHSIQTGEDFKIENRWLRHDGSYHWYLALGIAQKNEQGKIIAWIGTNTNIEEQKKFAEELEEKVKQRTYQLHIQNETFKQAEESSKQGSYSFNLTTGKLSYSDNLFRLIGYEPNEFEPSLEEFNKHVHPEDRDYVTQAAGKVVASKTADTWHYRMYTKNGTGIYIKGTGRVIESGDEKLLVGTLQDVTKEFELNKELQEKEEYRKQIINNAPDAVIVINEKSIITLWNPKTEEIFGWKAEEVLGLHLTDIIVPTQYRQAHREGMKRFLKTGEARILNRTLELTALNKEGKEFPISITISQAMQQGNKLFIAFLRDITLEKRTKELARINQSLLKANTELEASQKLSEKLLKQRDEFISIASHEMKTPLTTAKGYTQLLLLSLSEENPSVLYATKTDQAIERLNRLVTELLDASKIQNGQLNY